MLRDCCRTGPAAQRCWAYIFSRTAGGVKTGGAQRLRALAASFTCVCSLPATVSSFLLLTGRVTYGVHHQRADLHAHARPGPLGRGMNE